MSLWCSLGDQLTTLPVFSGAPGLGQDRLLVFRNDRSFSCQADYVDVPFSLVGILNGGSNPVSDAATPKDAMSWPFPATALALRVTVATGYGAGTAPGFDFLNSPTSMVDGTTTANAVMTLASNAATVTVNAAPAAPTINTADRINLFVPTGSTTIGQSWGFVNYTV